MKHYRVLIGLNEIEIARWTDFISNHPNATVFQSPDLYIHLKKSANYEPVVVGLADDDNNLIGILSGFIIREFKGLLGTFYSRVIVHGGPLILPEHDETAESCRRLLKAFIDLVRTRSIIIQFRNHYDLTQFQDTFEQNGFIFREHLNLIVDTNSSESVTKNISKSKLRQVKKSIEAGAVIVPAGSSEDIREFYFILKDLYRHKVKKPLPPLNFFEDFYESTREDKLGVVLLVKFGGKVVAGMVCPITPGKVMYEWYVCGKDKEFRQIYPSVLITWGAIDFAIKNNIPLFDFMGMGSPYKEYGVRNFKTGFGGKIVNFGRYTRINNRFLFNIAKLGFKILAKLKKV
jgi:serine/alanine adding enzyme